ncbi:hypothetical protein C1H46_019869 [Malus baccata]|uniref:RNA polymerase sigma-70 region 2 domain-containing protein n=1 Tax=Malus baccata TaxID=106549 RepID=A0A540M797_MALBA|nr:hypothetical protein C1H46_019869 [Malus baccata]
MATFLYMWLQSLCTNKAVNLIASTISEATWHGVVTVSTSPAGTSLRLSTKSTSQRSTFRKPLIVAFETDESNKTALVAPQVKIPLPIEAPKKHQNRLGKARKLAKSVKPTATEEAAPCTTLEVDYNETAAKLENLYKCSPEIGADSDVEDADGLMRRDRKRRKKTSKGDHEKEEKRTSGNVVRSKTKNARRLNLDKRVVLKWNKDEKVHNLRLVLFVINKSFQDFANGPKFQDLCQAGVRGLITAIDRFEPKKSFQISTYGLFWIRHAIIRSMTVSSFTRISFGLESRYLSRNFTCLSEWQRRRMQVTSNENLCRHATTREEYINGSTDVDGVKGDNRRKPALLRLAIDDVLDSLKPKEKLGDQTHRDTGLMVRVIEH